MVTEAEYRALCESRNELHKLMRRVVVSTKFGRQQKRPDDDIEMNIGGGSLCSCARYGQVRYHPGGSLDEYQLDDDTGMLNYLIVEIKKKFNEFQKARDSNKPAYAKRKKLFAGEYFNPPLTEIDKEQGD